MRNTGGGKRWLAGLGRTALIWRSAVAGFKNVTMKISTILTATALFAMPPVLAGETPQKIDVSKLPQQSRSWTT
jgi:hypothetical protein